MHDSIIYYITGIALYQSNKPNNVILLWIQQKKGDFILKTWGMAVLSAFAMYILGNKYISILTGSGNYELRIEMTDTTGALVYAEYSTFKVNGADQKYSLVVSGYSGDAGLFF